MRVAIASAMAASTLATCAANSSSRRVPPPKSTRNAASLADEAEVGPEPDLDLLVRGRRCGGGLGDLVEQQGPAVGEHPAVAIALGAAVLVPTRPVPAGGPRP